MSIGVIAFLVAAVLTTQVLALRYIRFERKNWSGAVRYYRAHMICAWSVLAFFLAVCFAIAVLSVAGNGSQITAYFEGLFLDKYSFTVFVTIVIAGVVRWAGGAFFVDEHGHHPDVWLPWLVVCCIAAALGARAWPADASPPVSPALAFGVSLVTGFTYFIWIYLAVSKQLEQRDGLRGPVVQRFLLRWSSPPKQIVVIGPKASGKTTLVRAYVTKQLPASDPMTLIPTFHSTQQSFAISETDTESYKSREVSICDTPGENLGDHIAITARYRMHKLVLVIRANAFQHVANLAKHPLDSIEAVVGLLEPVKGRDRAALDARVTRDYLQALKLSTNRHRESEFSSPHRIDQVLLLVNYAEETTNPDYAGEAAVASTLKGRLPQLHILAEKIGKRLGIDPSTAQTDCFSAVVSVKMMRAANLITQDEFPSHD